MHKLSYKIPVLLIITLFVIAALLFSIVENELSFSTGISLMIYAICNTLYVTWDDCYK